MFRFLLLFLIASPAVHALPGDWSSSGGGSGVACFDDVRTAKEAEAFIQKGKPLPAKLLEKSTLRLLESWEMEQNGTRFWTPSTTKWQEIHAQSRGYIKMVAPLFATRLEIAGGWSDFGKWEEKSELSLLDDATPIAPLPENCRRIQLVLRYSNGNAGPSPAPGAIQVHVTFNQAYFQKLPPLDQAMLVLHEELYVIGQARGFTTSDQIRGFVRTFFSHDFVAAHSDPRMLFLLRGSGDAALRTYLVQFFSDYVEYFVLQDKPLNAAPFSSKHHFETYMSFLRERRPLIGACREKGGENRQCADRYMSPAVVESQLNEEGSFLYLTSFWLDQSVGILNFDYLVRPQDDDKDFADAVAFSCEKLRDLQLRVGPALVPKAQKYCASWRANRGL